MKTVSFLIAPALFVLSCSTNQKQTDHTTRSFKVTGKAEAIPFFQQRIKLVHNFEYEDAAEAFIKAQKANPVFAMAYWGATMAYNHPAWGSLDLEKTRECIARLGKFRAEKICREILNINPDHPGALHDLIHAADHPVYTQGALAAAQKYAQVASDAGLALHMPAHMELGMWSEHVKSNEQSWQASRAYYLGDNSTLNTGVAAMKRSFKGQNNRNYPRKIFLFAA